MIDKKGTSVNPNDFDNIIGGDLGDLSEKATLLSRIERLEKQIEYLMNKPAVYVPPPLYGPTAILYDQSTLPELSQEDLDELLELFKDKN